MNSSRAKLLSWPLVLLVCAQCEGLVNPTPQAPKTPSALNATPGRAGEIEVRWTDPSDNETHHEVEARRADNTSWYSLGTTPANGLFYRHTGLQARITYVYRVRACNEQGCSNYSNEASATVAAPQSPSGLAATPSGSGRIDLNWKDNSNDETGFEVEYRRAPYTTWSQLNRTAPNTAVYSHTQLNAGVTYSYRVRACSDAGCSDPSEEAAATVSGPKAPSTVTAAPVGSGRIDLHWQDNSNDETSFRVDYRRAPYTDWSTLKHTAPNVISLSHIELQAGTTYGYRVSACNASGCSEPSEPVQATVSGPNAPSNLTATPVGSGRVNLHWQDNSNDEASFRVDYRRAPYTDWSTLKHTAPNVISLSHIELQAGTTYSYRISACNASGCSEPSTEAMATVGAPAQPSNLTATPVGSGRIDLVWQDNSSDETSIQVQARGATSSIWSVIANLAPNSRTYSHSGLQAGSTYVYRVRACDASGCSPYSNEVSATASGPVAPSNLTASATESAISLTWQDNSADEERFQVEVKGAGSLIWSLLVNLQPGVTRYTHTGLQPGVSNTYRIRACNAAGCSAYSNEVTATTASSQSGPSAPSDLRADAALTAINLTWRDNSTNEERFQVDVRAAGSTSWSQLVNTPAGATSHSHSGLKDGDSFAYRVRACNTGGCSSYSNEVTATVRVSDAPAPPTLNSPANWAQGVAQKPTFSWSAIPGATTYRVMVATSATVLPSDKDQDTCSGCTLNTEVSATSLASTVQLLAGTLYRWQVKARTQAGWSYWSPIASFTTAYPESHLSCPTGWKSESNGRGVLLCSKSGERATQYVLQVDLKRGAQVESIHGAQATASPGSPSPLFSRLTVKEWWNRKEGGFLSDYLCMVNGAHFMTSSETEILLPARPTELSFPLREGGRLVTTGREERPRSKYALIIHSKKAVIREHSLPGFSAFGLVNEDLADADRAVVALRHDTEPLRSEGQTFAAVRDLDGDNQNEIVLFYVSTDATPADAKGALINDFKVVNSFTGIVRLDAGQSSQLYCEGGVEVPRSGFIRQVPHVFAISEGPPK